MKNKKITLICSIGLILVLVASLVLAACAKEEAPAPAAPAVTAETYSWRLQTHAAAGYPMYEIPLSKTWPALISERSNGRIEVTPYPASALCPVPEMLDALGQNMFELNTGCPAYWKGFMPVGNVEGGLAGAWRDPSDAFNIFWDRGVEENILRPVYAEHNVMYITVLPGSHITLVTQEPIRKAADFQGHKYRTFGSFLDLFELLGAPSVFVPHGEIYTAIATGTVEGAATSPAAMFGIKLYEQVNYIVQPELIGCYNDQMLMNMDIWNSLDEDMQQLFIATSREYAHYYGRIYESQEAEAYLGFAEKGVETCYIEDWVENVVPLCLELWERAAAEDATSKKLVDEMVSYFKEVGYVKE